MRISRECAPQRSMLLRWSNSAGLGSLGLHPSPYPIHMLATPSTAERTGKPSVLKYQLLYYGLSNPPSLNEHAGQNINPALPLSNKMLFQLAWWSSWPDDDSHSQMCNLPSGSLLVWTPCLYTLIPKTARDKREIPVWLYETVCYRQQVSHVLATCCLQNRPFPLHTVPCSAPIWKKTAVCDIRSNL